MKRKMLLSLTALVLALAVNVAFAQSKSHANVPFAFSVEQKWLPAGEYRIATKDHVLEIRNYSTNEAADVIAQHEESTKPQISRLVFHKYGDRYFLAEVWTATGEAGAAGMELTAGKAEQETRASYKDASGPETVILAMR
jgi:hypothetical protein